MKRSTVLVSALLVLSLALAGCTGNESSPQVPENGESSPAEDAAGSRLAPGLHDRQDGKVTAVGTLEYRDLEGGFYVITQGTPAEGGEGEVVVVIANSQDLKDALAELVGKQVSADGTRQEGPSIRSAGPEMIVETISEITDTGGPAD